MVGLITNNDESGYHRKSDGASELSLLLNICKTKELVLDFRESVSHHLPLPINGPEVERVFYFPFLETTIHESLS